MYCRPVLATCQSGTSAILSSDPNGPVAHESTREGQGTGMPHKRTLTNLEKAFICALLMWQPIVFRAIPTLFSCPDPTREGRVW